ncbi:PREDICTED: tetraspanin-6-like isoform X1 [Rhagoletis zephyria]|uniref:tetraspanin-6-like isoform X1 n=1 Tax=Rhagoletis zephyria TaxID=28612 RepID=UPI000811482F|nr:PREDICTED: tetraspanin-6-like isoform X1 [Rhagoletis zephyria]XP_017483354.1 PREDICTED: tetraspanin-6-like isoform X1 [Rhagoletis zephyria]
MLCSTPLLRHIFLCANTLCLIVGLIMALICALFMNSVQNTHLIYCLLGLMVGLVTALSALVGYKAIKPPKAAMLSMYCALFTILCVTQAYIVTHLAASNIITATVQNVELLWEREMVSEGPMASIESRFHCCGLHNYSDYTSTNLPLPASCFYTENDAWIYYTDGCLEKVKFAAGRASDALSIAGFLLTATQVMALIFSSALTLAYYRTGEYQEL